jgi:hypothetical protein
VTKPRTKVSIVLVSGFIVQKGKEPMRAHWLSLMDSFLEVLLSEHGEEWSGDGKCECKCDRKCDRECDRRCDRK